MNGIIELGLPQMLLAYVFAVVVIILLKYRKIPQEKLVFLATIRMSFQLIIAGYLLQWVISNPHPLMTLLIIAIMQVFSVITVIRKFKKPPLSKSLQRVITIVFPVGSLSVLFYFLFVVVRISPWFNPQYFIPLAGMIVGNSMTGISLAVKSMHEKLTIEKARVEEALILGATLKQATESIINRTFDQAIVPTLNNMLGMGIIFLPGMMTGQILSGTNPTTAIFYQMAIMLGILGGVAITVYLILVFGIKTYFNRQLQFQELDS